MRDKVEQRRKAEARGQSPEMYLDVRICCTCCGVSAKVKCASSNLWLEVDAEDTKAQSLPSPGLRSHLLPSQTSEPTRLKPQWGETKAAGTRVHKGTTASLTEGGGPDELPIDFIEGQRFHGDIGVHRLGQRRVQVHLPLRAQQGARS